MQTELVRRPSEKHAMQSNENLRRHHLGLGRSTGVIRIVFELPQRHIGSHLGAATAFV
jgi:hypothetical protein